MHTADSDVLDLLRTIEAKTARTVPVGRLVRRIGPFVAFLHPTCDIHWMSGAIPDSSAKDDSAVPAAVAELRRWFAEHGRRLRIETLDPLWPELGDLLTEAGMSLEHRMPIMLCAPGELAPVTAPPDMAIEPVTAESPSTVVHEFLATALKAFGDAPPEPHPDRITEHRAALAQGLYRSALARVDGVPIATGSMTVPNDELVGIATLPEFRRRGIGAAVSHFLVRKHFDAGAPVAWLTAADETARRVYARIGFRAVGDQLTFRDGAYHRPCPFTT